MYRMNIMKFLRYICCRQDSGNNQLTQHLFMKSKIIPAALLAFGLIVLGFTLKAGIDNIAFRDREVTAVSYTHLTLPTIGG